MSGRRREVARRRLHREASALEAARLAADAGRPSMEKLDELRNAEEALEEAALVYAKELGWKPPAVALSLPTPPPAKCGRCGKTTALEFTSTSVRRWCACGWERTFA